MNIPGKIKIGWKDYTIEKTDVSEKLLLNGDICYGEIEYDDQIIRLNNSFSDEQKEATLIHEMIHGISNMYTLDMSEDLVTKLANALYITIKDNLSIFK